MPDVTITLTDKHLRELYEYNRRLTVQNDDGMPFEFWHVVGLLDVSDEIIEEVKRVGWVPPSDEELGIEEDDEDVADDEPAAEEDGSGFKSY